MLWVRTMLLLRALIVGTTMGLPIALLRVRKLLLVGRLLLILPTVVPARAAIRLMGVLLLLIGRTLLLLVGILALIMRVVVLLLVGILPMLLILRLMGWGLANMLVYLVRPRVWAGIGLALVTASTQR